MEEYVVWKKKTMFVLLANTLKDAHNLMRVLWTLYLLRDFANITFSLEVFTFNFLHILTIYVRGTNFSGHQDAKTLRFYVASTLTNFGNSSLPYILLGRISSSCINEALSIL